MTGRYSILQMYTDVPLDLDFDGIATTNMMEEIHCNYPVALFSADLVYNELFDRQTMNVDIPAARINSDVPPYDQTFSAFVLFYDIAVSAEDGSIVVTDRDDEFEELHGKLTAVNCENDVLTFEYDRMFFTADGWTEVKLYMIYNKDI